MTVKEKALALVGRCPIGLLGNTDDNGKPQIKAMFKTRNEGLKTFWFCSNASSKRVQQLTRQNAACLYFHEFNSNDKEAPCKGVMLSGVAEVLYDDRLRISFWQDGMEIYYPQGPLDPDFAVIRFTAEDGNYYAGLSNEDFSV